MAGHRSWTRWRRSTNQPSRLIEIAYGAGLTGAYVENNDLARSHAERVNCFVHINNAGEAQLSGRDPLGLSRVRVDLPNGGRNNDNRGPALGTHGSSKIRVKLSASAE